MRSNTKRAAASNYKNMSKNAGL